jgi:ornithine cyclodeaminase
MRACVDLMAEALAARARGDAIQPLRTPVRLPDGSGLMVTMPAWVGSSAPALGVKVISVFPGNRERGEDSHQGAVLAVDPDTGALVALLEAGAVTAVRTAAVSAVATRQLAVAGAADLAILGAGTQAVTHLEAMCVVRPIKRVRIWNRTPSHAVSLAQVAREKFGLAAEVVNGPKEAVSGATIICTVTGAPEPILKGDWLSPGSHINAVGSSVASTRELDSDAVAKASLFVDSRESALNEAGDLLIPIQEGRVTQAHIQAELGEVLIGRHPGRTSPTEITLFKSLGLGIEDVAAARYVVEQARRAGAGTEVPLLA